MDRFAPSPADGLGLAATAAANPEFCESNPSDLLYRTLITRAVHSICDTARFAARDAHRAGDAAVELHVGESPRPAQERFGSHTCA